LEQGKLIGRRSRRQLVTLFKSGRHAGGTSIWRGSAHRGHAEGGVFPWIKYKSPGFVGPIIGALV